MRVAMGNPNAGETPALQWLGSAGILPAGCAAICY